MPASAAHPATGGGVEVERAVHVRPARRSTSWWRAVGAPRTSSGPIAHRPRPTRTGTPGRRARPTMPRKAETGVMVSATSSRHTGHHAVLGGEGPEPVRAGPRRRGAGLGHRSRRRRSPSVRRRRGRNSCGARCDRHRHLPGRRSRAGRRRRSRTGRAARTAARRTSRPCTTTPGGSGSRTTMRPVSRVSWSDSSFIQANMSTVPSEASCTMAATSPSALKAIGASSSVGEGDGHTQGTSAAPRAGRACLGSRRGHRRLGAAGASAGSLTAEVSSRPSGRDQR